MELSKKRRLFRILIIAIFLGFMVLLIADYASGISSIVSSPSRIRHFIASYGNLSVLAFILLQTIAVILAPIPSDLLFISGGYVYGTIFGALYSFIGVALGTTIVFWISSICGSGLVKFFIPDKQFERFQFLMNCPKAERVLFLLYLVPEMPKDIMTYIVGLTPLNPVRFLAIALTARLPCILGSSYIGANLQQKKFGPVFILLVLVGMLLLAIFITKDRLLRKLSGRV